MNAEFQRIARRDKKTFLSDNAKKYRKTIEWERLEISRKSDTKGTFHAKMGTIKEMAWTQQKLKILRRRGKNTLK